MVTTETNLPSSALELQLTKYEENWCDTIEDERKFYFTL
jgi:hypothetical protein